MLQQGDLRAKLLKRKRGKPTTEKRGKQKGKREKEETYKSTSKALSYTKA